MPQMQTFQTRHAPETVTSCCKLQAAGVWFRTTLKGRPSRPPSRPAHGTNVNTLPVQGRVSQSLAASNHSNDQATNYQGESSNPNCSPALTLMPQVQAFQTRHAPETVTSCCKLQAARVWFRTTLKGRPSRPPSRPAHAPGAREGLLQITAKTKPPTAKLNQATPTALLAFLSCHRCKPSKQDMPLKL